MSIAVLSEQMKSIVFAAKRVVILMFRASCSVQEEPYRFPLCTQTNSYCCRVGKRRWFPVLETFEEHHVLVNQGF
jgi:hypothetical protein